MLSGVAGISWEEDDFWEGIAAIDSYTDNAFDFLGSFKTDVEREFFKNSFVSSVVLLTPTPENTIAPLYVNKALNTQVEAVMPNLMREFHRLSKEMTITPVASLPPTSREMLTMRKENEDLRNQLTQSHRREWKLQVELSDMRRGRSKSRSLVLNNHPASPFEPTLLEKSYKAQLDRKFAHVENLESRNQELEIGNMNLHRQIEMASTRPTQAAVDLSNLIRDRDVLHNKLCSLEASIKELEGRNGVLTREVSYRTRELQLMTHAHHTPLPSTLTSGLSSHTNTMTREKAFSVTQHLSSRKPPLPVRQTRPQTAHTTPTTPHTTISPRYSAPRQVHSNQHHF
ncbi:hypothetical protein Pelo_17237 [Pelomyxa schiedti]|nr:hypothetical protein Pelo_17237 [Pelomyxa schiedti]